MSTSVCIYSICDGPLSSANSNIQCGEKKKKKITPQAVRLFWTFSEGTSLLSYGFKSN